MSILAAITATAALGFITGWLSTRLTIRKLRTEITSLREQIATLDSLLRVANYIAGHDRLTGLPNRSTAARIFHAAELLGRPTIVALVDLDRFKHINDSYGHHIGDDLLRTVAERLAQAAKDQGGTAARLAGDEFLLLLPATGDDPAQPVTQALDLLSEETVLYLDDGEFTVHPSASAGIAVYDGTYSTYGAFDTLLYHADIALHHAKQQPGSHRTYQPQMRLPHNAGRHGPRRRDRQPPNTGGQLGGEVTR